MNIMIITGDSAAIAAAYIKARAEIQTTMAKDATGVHKSKYVKLSSAVEAITPILLLHGLTLMQEPISNEYGVGVATAILHESGATIEFTPLTIPLANREPHTVGSALSYARRYAIFAVFGLAADDDDGQQAQESFKAKAAKPAAGDYHDDELWDAPAQHDKKPERVSQAQLTRLHILGSDLYGPEWDDQRPKLVQAVTKGAETSSKELTPAEAETLIKGIERKLKEVQSLKQNGKAAA